MYDSFKLSDRCRFTQNQSVTVEIELRLGILPSSRKKFKIKKVKHYEIDFNYLNIQKKLPEILMLH